MVDQPFGKYSDAAAYVTDKPAHSPLRDQDRIAAYQVYQRIYWSYAASTFRVMNRGLDVADEPVYVPSSRIVIDTMDRYVGANLAFKVDMQTGTESTQLLATQWFTALFARERFYSKYNEAKRAHFLTQGDMAFHLVADPEKLEGSRISILMVDPATLYKTYEDEVLDGGDPDKLVRVQLVELVMAGDEEQARVQTYERLESGTILSTLEMWKPDEWHQADKSPIAIVFSAELPPTITAFPVYHIPNGYGDYGTSELRGLLTLQAALNQSVTDEDLAIALEGLGVYATDESQGAVDAQGNATSLYVSPGIVLENAKGLKRVTGITSVQPYTDHIGRMEGYLADATGATDAARGRLEVTEAESGIALQLKLGPTLSKAAIKDQILLDVLGQMFYDLTQMWFPTFESVNFTDVLVTPVFGDKLPVNRQAEATLVSELFVAGLLSGASARRWLAARGFEGMFDPAEAELILAEKVAVAAAEGGDSEMDREGREGESALGSPEVE